MAPNPYRWQHDRPAHLVAREQLVGRIEGHLRRGLAVKLIGGRGMGKSVLLRQVQACFADEPDTRAVIVPGPPEEGTPVACVQDIAARLGLGPLSRMSMDAVMEAAQAQGIERLIVLVDEVDQYVQIGPNGDLAKAWFNRLEALRKAWMDRVAVVIAGGLGDPPRRSRAGLGAHQSRGDLCRGAVRAGRAAPPRRAVRDTPSGGR